MTTAVLTAIEEALNAHLVGLVFSPVVPIAWQNLSYTPMVGHTYLRPKLFPNRTDVGAVGVNAPRRHRGLYQVSVYGAVDVGLADTWIADAIIEHFNAEVLERNGVRVRIGSFDGSASVPSRLSSFREGEWNVIPVTIPWWNDTY